MSIAKLGETVFRAKSTIRCVETGHSGCSDDLLESLCTTFPDAADKLRELVEDDSLSKSIPLRHSLIGTRSKPRNKPRQSARDLAGVWHACWQTLCSGYETFVTEPLTVCATTSLTEFRMEAAGTGEPLGIETANHSTVTSEPFPWQADCQMTDEYWICGQFAATSGPRVHGVFRLKLDSFATTLVGDWLGVSSDAERTIGILVIARSEEGACRAFADERARHPDLPSAPGLNGASVRRILDTDAPPTA